MPDFEKITEYLTSGILFSNDRENVKNELYDHLMCHYETNIACGMNEEEAVNAAKKNLGNLSILKFQLEKTHHYNPVKAFNFTSFSVITGVILVLICNVIYCMNSVAGFFAAVVGFGLSITGAGSLQKAIGKFRPTALLFVLSGLMKLTTYILTPYTSDLFDLIGETGNTIIKVVIEYLYPLILVLPITFLKYDMIKLAGAQKNNSYKDKVLVPCVFVAFFSFFRELDPGSILKNNTGINMFYDSRIAVSEVILSLIFSFLTFCLFKNYFSKIKADGKEYFFESSYYKSVRNVLLCLLSVIISISAADILYSGYSARQIKVYEKNDCELSESEYKRICGELKKYGVTDEIINVLSKSEIETFKYIEPFSENSNFYQRCVTENEELDTGFYETDKMNYFHCAIPIDRFAYGDPIKSYDKTDEYIMYLDVYDLPESSGKGKYNGVFISTESDAYCPVRLQSLKGVNVINGVLMNAKVNPGLNTENCFGGEVYCKGRTYIKMIYFAKYTEKYTDSNEYEVAMFESMLVNRKRKVEMFTRSACDYCLYQRKENLIAPGYECIIPNGSKEILRSPWIFRYRYR